MRTSYVVAMFLSFISSIFLVGALSAATKDAVARVYGDQVSWKLVQTSWFSIMNAQFGDCTSEVEIKLTYLL